MRFRNAVISIGPGVLLMTLAGGLLLAGPAFGQDDIIELPPMVVTAAKEPVFQDIRGDSAAGLTDTRLRK